MNFNLAYLAQGKLYLKFNQDPARTIESEFGQSVEERMLQMQRRSAWKNKNIMDNFLPPALAQQIQEQDQPKLPIEMTSLCHGPEGKLIYALKAGDVSGIFSLEPSTNKEQRLFHGSEQEIRYLNFNSAKNLIACSLVHRNGTANIGIMQADGIRPNEVTEGDSVDLAPRWVPGGGRSLVYQSAGIGRDRNGYACDQGPFTIERLDFDKQDVACLLSDPKYDFLGPQMTADETLYYIRRPYRSLQKRFNLLHLLRDVVLIPFRLVYAIFQWLNFFTHRYTGKPLTMAGAPRSLDIQPMAVWGNAINPELALKNRFGDADAPALVPRSWQLIRQKLGSDPEVIAEGVLAFDLKDDGSILYSNGSAIYSIKPGGSSERLLVQKWIEQVVAL